ncbi:hypothetical protein R3P38DRAFT_2765147 [Favolaschia claudopus]|uniref:Uncharacterized protein n=1 Tax=Favolaschia claudopus TaxID=2862362 RepID=A0AAW0D1H3_9AGAR
MSSSTQASVSSEVSAAVRPLNALYYSLNGAYEVPVPTVFLTSPSAFSFPNLEHLLLSSRTPGSIRTVRGAVEHSTESGEIMTTRFVCFFENHPNLPFNTTLNIQGAILVMRAAADGVTLINMDSSELWLADMVAEKSVPAVRWYQLGQGPRVNSFVIAAHAQMSRQKLGACGEKVATRRRPGRSLIFKSICDIQMPTSDIDLANQVAEELAQSHAGAHSSLHHHRVQVDYVFRMKLRKLEE